jgi:hypothetical protein
VQVSLPRTVAADEVVEVEFAHSLHAQRDLHARLHERNGAWVAGARSDAGSRWRVVVADPRAPGAWSARCRAAARRCRCSRAGAAMNARLQAPALCAHCGESTPAAPRTAAPVAPSAAE